MEYTYQKKSLVLVVLAVAVFTGTCEGGMFGADGTCGTQKNYPGDNADVTITGLIRIHDGPQCESPNPAGVQMLEAARWAATKINQEQLIPGTTLGVDIRDTCGSGDAALRAAMSAVVEGGILSPCKKNKACRHATGTGCSGPSRTLLAGRESGPHEPVSGRTRRGD